MSFLSISGVVVILIVVISLALMIGLAFIPSNIARKKGRSAVGYFFFGFFAFIPALIVSLCISDLTKQNQDNTTVPNFTEQN